MVSESPQGNSARVLRCKPDGGGLWRKWGQHAFRELACEGGQMRFGLEEGPTHEWKVMVFLLKIGGIRAPGWLESVKHLTLDLSSGFDLRVVGSSPTWGSMLGCWAWKEERKEKKRKKRKEKKKERRKEERKKRKKEERKRKKERKRKRKRKRKKEKKERERKRKGALCLCVCVSV